MKRENIRQHLIRFFREDWKSNKKRFIAEIAGLILGIGATIVMAATMPTPNLLVSYIMWELSAMCLIYGAMSRKSFGLTLLYVLYFTIDGVGLIRLLTIPV